MSNAAPNSTPTSAAPAVSSAVTIIERSGAEAATLIEAGGPSAVSVDATSFAVGMEVFGCTLREPMKVISGEADLWLADRRGERVVIKVYRRGLHPEAEIAAVLEKSDRRHVVRLLERGMVPDGRSVEVLEYISGGTLAGLMPRATTEEALRLEIVRELAHALDELHRDNLMHRDIKPANVLVRSTQPLDLVLADFGISSVTELDLYKTTRDRTVAYSAPESTQGIVSKGSDWWSLGIVVLEILLGRHPFADLDDLNINLQLVTRPIPLPESLPPRWRTLVSGLLTKDPENRWRFEQVSRWLAGEENIAVHFEFASALAATSATAKPFRFEQREFLDAAVLAVALAQSPIEGAKCLDRGFLSGWLASQLGEHELASQLEDLREDKQLKPAEKLALAVMLMGPELPLFINGRVATPDWLSENLSMAIPFIEGPIPDWLGKHRNDRQYIEIRERRKNIHATLERAGVAYDKCSADRLAFSKPTEVLALAEKVRRTYAGATLAILDAALHESPLRELTAALLLVAERAQFISWQQHFNKCLSDSFKRLKTLDQLIGKDVTTGSKLQASLIETDKIKREINELRESCGAHISIASEATADVENLIDSCGARARTRLQEHAEHQQLLDMARRGKVTAARNLLIHRPFSDIDYDKVEEAVQEWTDAITQLQALIDEQIPKGPVAPKSSIFSSDAIFLEKQRALAAFLRQVAPQIGEIEQVVGSQRGTEVFEESRLGVAKLRRSFDWLQDFVKAQNQVRA